MITKEELQRLYVDEHKTLAIIGDMYGVTGWSVCRWLKKYGMKARTRKNIKCNNSVLPTDKELEILYIKERKSMMTISQELNISLHIIVALMKKYKIKLRTLKQALNGNKKLIKRQNDVIPTKDELQEWYVNEKLSTIVIGKMYGLSGVGVRYYLLKYGIKTRTLSEASPKIRPWHKGKKYHLGKHHSEETKENLRKFHIGKSLPKETRDKMSKSLLRNWQKPEYRDRTTKLAMLGNHIKPNKPEIFIQSLLDKMYPAEYEYTGDGKKIIGGKCPDFYNKSKNNIILFHGIYWHLIKFQCTNPNLTKEEVEIKDSAHYKKYGYDTLIIWEDELIDINAVLNKISIFHNKTVVIGEKPTAICEAENASGVLPKIGGEKYYVWNNSQLDGLKFK